jgi:hypothetical protein
MQFETNGLQHTLSTVMVFQTSEYGRFKMLQGNRELNEAKIKRIIRDIESGIDVLKYYPIQVTERNGRLEIIDGQHRFFIAKKLKREVHYIIMKEERQLPDIAKINSNTEKWKTKDFINCYIQQGNNNYEQLQWFMDTYGFTVTVSIKLLSKGDPGTESGIGDSQDFQRGLFKVEFFDKAIEVAEMCKKFNAFQHWKDRGFIIAIYRISQTGKITVDELLEKYKKHPDMLKKQAGFKDYIFQLESLYNRGRQARVVIY